MGHRSRRHGCLQDGFHIELKHQKRSVALIVNRDPKTLIIEAKTGQHGARAEVGEEGPWLARLSTRHRAVPDGLVSRRDRGTK
jgi:hypothetical protein